MFDTSSYTIRPLPGQVCYFSIHGYTNRKNDHHLGNYWRYSLVARKMALDNANLSQQVLETRRGGNLSSKRYKKMSPYFIPYQITNMGPTLLAINTGSMGPNYSILLSCASANCSFCSAANHIRSGDADIMVESGMEAGVTATDVG
ncbi:hypothetical protein BC332_06333 [Capsicum chinense]|nr:hypothetical protein BC332_06333 [Capsicum chinense]